MSSILQDGGKTFKPAYGAQVAGYTAGTTYDNIEHTCLTLDRLGYDSLQINIHHLLSLTADKTLKATVTLQDCTTAQGTYADYSTVATDYTCATGALTASKGVTSFNVDLSGCDRYIQALVSLDLNASGTDTCQAYIEYILTGARSLPVS